MPVWESPSVADEPEVSISHWQILEISTGQRFFVGHDVRYNVGRVSTPVCNFDPVSLRGETQSGRRYQMFGAPCHDLDGQWLWGLCCRARGYDSFKDVAASLLVGLSTGSQVRNDGSIELRLTFEPAGDVYL